ncbi:MAG TPA: hypothetical protein VNW25_00815 [Candidatus Sulfotelmatobacter sp.]|nr:hypothetical protein [Candidatus Sulfotelmatobacter sp.]
MGIYHKFALAKKGMSTIFGGLFFIILILMGFNLMLWGFIQYDNYNTTTFKMSQNDQLASSENLVPTNPGAQNFTSTSFIIPVNNLGGTTVSIARIYITNISPTGGTQCTSTGASAGPCIVDSGAGSQNCAGNGNCYLTNGNIGAGEINHLIHVNGLAISDGSGYKVILSSTRGRLFSFFYPWPVSSQNNGGGSGTFVTNIGPLSVYFDFKSFNFTQGFQTQSQSAFCVPSGTTILVWVKIVNAATDSDVKLEASTMLEGMPYSANGFGKFVRTWIVDPGSVNPGNIVAYNFNTNPYDLPAAGPNGPGAPVIVKFGGSGQGGTGGVSFGQNDNWLTFIGFYYIYRGQAQGETIPFMDLKDTSGYPGSC